MKKRLRKKLHKGEFTEYGFEVIANFVETDNELIIGNITFDAWLDDLIEEVEKHNLFISGGGSFTNFSCYIVAGPRKSATNADRQAMINFLSRQEIIKSFEVKELTSAWN